MFTSMSQNSDVEHAADNGAVTSLKTTIFEMMIKELLWCYYMLINTSLRANKCSFAKNSSIYLNIELSVEKSLNYFFLC